MEAALTVPLVVEDALREGDPRILAWELERRIGVQHTTIQTETDSRACTNDCAADRE